MALIKCPECNKEVSDKAKSCINCGYPLNEAEELNKTFEEPESIEENEEPEITVYNEDEIINEKFSFFNGISKENAEKVKKKTKLGFLIGVVASFVIMLVFFKASFGLGFFLSLLFGGGIALVLMSVLNLYYYFKKNNSKSEKRKAIKGIGLFFVIFIPLCFFFYFIVGGDNGGSNGPSDAEMNACRARSNTYFKCSWATFENRCVCKAR